LAGAAWPSLLGPCQTVWRQVDCLGKIRPSSVFSSQELSQPQAQPTDRKAKDETPCNAGLGIQIIILTPCAVVLLEA